MNRRTFLTWTLASCALGIVGCGPRPAAQTDAANAAPAAPAVLAAPPLASKPSAASGSKLPNRLEIPAIDVDIPVVELGWSNKTDRAGQIFSEWDVAEYAAGWHKNSALPGEPGNVVMSGHNNILGAVFRELDQLKADDPITVWVDTRRYDYAVDQVVVVPDKSISAEQRVENARWIGDFEDDRLTLVSCWPRNNNTHRIIVVARPADAQARS
jgi:sortase A